MSLSNYLENWLLSLIFKGATYWTPNIAVDLSRTVPTERGVLDPPTHASYAAVQTTPATWYLYDPGEVRNYLPVQFPEATGDWGEITHIVLSDMDYYGMMLAYGAIPMVHITSGMRPLFVPNALVTILS